MEREVVRVKHDISNNLHQLQFISIVWYLILTLSNNCECTCNATRHERDYIKTELWTKISVYIKLHCIKVREIKSAYYLSETCPR